MIFSHEEPLTLAIMTGKTPRINQILSATLKRPFSIIHYLTKQSREATEYGLICLAALESIERGGTSEDTAVAIVVNLQIQYGER